MSEPSVDFDWEAIEPETVDDSEMALREKIIREFLAMILPPQSLTVRGGGPMRLRVMISAYLVHCPGYERLLSLAHVADICGCDRRHASRVASSLKRSMGLRKKSTRSHRKRIK